MKIKLKILLCLFLSITIIFQAMPEVQATEQRLYGDVNQNGIVSSKDALMVLLYCVRDYEFDEEQLILADINNDASINVDDAYLILLCSSGLQTSFRIDDWKASGTIWIAADSIAEGGSTYVGWGQVIGQYLKEGTTVNNTALSGLTAKYYTKKEQYTRIMTEMQPGDILFIAFGHNDSKGGSDPYADSSTRNSYKNYLKYYYIEPTLRRGGIPILMTSVARCRDIAVGAEANQYHYLYIKAARELALEYKEIGIEIPFIDMFDMTYKQYLQIGQSTARSRYHSDEIHYKKAGAEFASQLILYSIYENGWDFARFIDMDKVTDQRTYSH